MDPKRRKYVTGTILLLLSCVLSTIESKKLTIESTISSEPQQYTCDKLKFPKVQFITCVCVEGIWAFLTTSDNRDKGGKGTNQWKILGGHPPPSQGSQCYQVGQWVSQVRRISSVTTKSSVKSLKENSNTFLVTNNQSWQVNLVVMGEEKKQKICLPAAHPNHYCIYKIPGSSIIVQEKSFVNLDECSPDSIKLKPIQQCDQLSPSVVVDEGSFVCDLVPPQQTNQQNPVLLKRQKRQEKTKPVDTGSTEPGSEPKISTLMAGPELDEDYVSPETTALFTGNEMMMAAITDYIRLAISRILELSTGRTKRAATSSPVSILLRLSNDIMKKLCPAINDDVFEVALESFVKLQKDTYHIKEPYIPYASYSRVLNALEKCSTWAQPIMFVPSTNETTNNETTNERGHHCDTAIPTRTSKLIRKDGQNRAVQSFPPHAYANPGVHDPVVETVWKAFLSAHSYCYKFFQDYFNDHHILTVSLMPFFTNRIQEIWFNGTDKPGNGTYTSDKIWYGNMLGNVGELFKNIDNCYGASRLYSDYPWYLNRPPRDQGQRRKRSIEPSEYAVCS